MKQVKILTRVFTGRGEDRNCQRELELTWNIPEDYKESSKVWGDVTSYACQMEGATVKAQALIRALLERSLKNDKVRVSDNDIRKAFGEDWIPPVGRRVDPERKEKHAQESLDGLSQEARARIFQKYKEELEAQERNR